MATLLALPFRFVSLIYRNTYGNPILPPPGTFTGQTILITGASGGLGLSTAIHFVNLGASRVIITARTMTKGLAAKKTIEEQTSTQGKDIVRVMELDMSTFEGVKLFTERVEKEVDAIDYLLLNAGVLNRTFTTGPSGFEESIQTNVLGSTLLALLLSPWIKATGKGKAHLGFVTSGLHRTIDISAKAGFPQEDVVGWFNREKNWPANGMYGTSKLLEQYCANEIAGLAGGEVIVNTICPGMVKSDLGRQYKTNVFLTLAVNIFMATVTKTTEAGARTYVLAALTTPEQNGMYVTHYQSDEEYKKTVEKSIYSPEGQKMQKQVWKEVLAILSEKVPEVKEIINSLEAR